jgi:hypothetical protein
MAFASPSRPSSDGSTPHAVPPIRSPSSRAKFRRPEPANGKNRSSSASSNTRVKDRPDLALLGSVRELDRAQLRAAIDQTFAFRGTHEVPAVVPVPPAAWTAPYGAMAASDELAWATIEALHDVVGRFLDPALADGGDQRWSPAAWAWSMP